MRKYCYYIICLSACFLLSTVTYGQTKKVVRERRTPNIQHTTEEKSSLRSKKRSKGNVSPSSNEIGFLVDGLRYLYISQTEVELFESSKVSGAISIPKEITYNGRKYSVTNIGVRAFYECSGLTSLIIPEGITSIEENAFYGCSDLTSVTIPNSVKSIGYGAFMGCKKLSFALIPNSETDINAMAFPSTTNVVRASSQKMGNDALTPQNRTDEEQLEQLLSRANSYASTSNNKEDQDKALRLYFECILKGTDEKTQKDVCQKISTLISNRKSFQLSSQYLHGKSNGNYSIEDMLIHPLFYFPTYNIRQLSKKLKKSLEQQFNWQLTFSLDQIKVSKAKNRANMPYVNGNECEEMFVYFGKSYISNWLTFNFNTQEEADRFYYDICMTLSNYRMNVSLEQWQFTHKTKGIIFVPHLVFDSIFSDYNQKNELNQRFAISNREKSVEIFHTIDY